MERESIKDRLNQALKHYGITQTELSRRTGIPKGSINQYCTGFVEPKDDRVFLICRALNVSEAWLMGFDVPMRPIFDDTDTSTLTDQERALVIKYRKLSGDDKKQVNRQIDGLLLLGEEKPI